MLWRSSWMKTTLLMLRPFLDIHLSEGAQRGASVFRQPCHKTPANATIVSRINQSIFEHLLLRTVDPSDSYTSQQWRSSLIQTGGSMMRLVSPWPYIIWNQRIYLESGRCLAMCPLTKRVGMLNCTFYSRLELKARKMTTATKYPKKIKCIDDSYILWCTLTHNRQSWRTMGGMRMTDRVDIVRSSCDHVLL